MLGFRGKVDSSAIDSNVYDLNRHYREHAFGRLITAIGYQPYFDPNNILSSKVLSNSNKTITHNSGTELGPNYIANSTTSGKYYIELTYSGSADDALSVGVLNANHTGEMRGQNDSDCFGRRFGQFGPEGADNINNGDYIGLALDADNKTLNIYVNNNLQSNMSGSFSVTGALFLGVEMWNGNAFTLVDLASYSYTEPSGYLAGWVQ